MNSQSHSSLPPVAVKRRAIAKGAAWSVPVIAVSAAAPARAASCTNSLFAQSWAPTATGLADTAKVTSSFVVPGVVGAPVQIEFDIAGGAGGGATFAGSGARVTGVIYTVGGATVDIVAGQGGYAQVNGQFNNNTGFTPGSFAGGQGFGNGGSVPGFSSVPAPDLYNNGGSGGGGSAIFVNGTLVAVAGGGGGMARGIFTAEHPDPNFEWVQGEPKPAKAGSGGTDAGIADLTVAYAPNTTLYARGGNGSVTTAAGVGSATFSGGTTLTSLTGNVGGAANALGANGASGIAVNNTTRTGGGYYVTSGGGGGGYTGGGSGGGLIHTTSVTSSGLAVGGGGGGGGNYVNPTFFPSGNPQPVQGLAGNESSSNTTRSPGWVRVEVFNCI